LGLAKDDPGRRPQERGAKETSWRERLTRVYQVLHDFLAGAALSWISPPYVIRRRAEMERMFALMLNADLLGLPLLPPHYIIRFLPYELSMLLSWQRMTAFDREVQWADLRHLGH
jgi:hypothetical protein